MKFSGIWTTLIGVASLLLASPASFSQGSQVDIALSQVGNAGNAADSTGYGSVGYTYDIGTYDVTISQYCTFLNDVATYSDPYGLYNSSMFDMGNSSGVTNVAGIVQSGSPGDYAYTALNGSQNDPVTDVSWFDAARFSNWLQNGEPVITGSAGEIAGSTETGAYTLDGDTTSGTETALSSATWRLPTENEWYKAAYYDPQLNGGAGGYYTYATQSNTAPGNNYMNPSLSNQANYNNGVYSVTQSSSYSTTQNYLTPVGSFTNSSSYYGTYDQDGEALQWNDSITENEFRGLRGGFWNFNSSDLESASRGVQIPTDENSYIGFRVVSTIPEPNSFMLMGVLILGGALVWRRPSIL